MVKFWCRERTASEASMVDYDDIKAPIIGLLYNVHYVYSMACGCHARKHHQDWSVWILKGPKVINISLTSIIVFEQFSTSVGD